MRTMALSILSVPMIMMLGPTLVFGVMWRSLGWYYKLFQNMKNTINFHYYGYNNNLLTYNNNQDLLGVIITPYAWRKTTVKDDTDISGSCPHQITIQSNAGSQMWKNRLGKYDLVRYDSTGNAIYEHSINKGAFLYKIKEANNVWMVMIII